MKAAAHDNTWIDSVCRQLSRVTGWPTSFCPAEGAEHQTSSAYRWTTELKTLDQFIGTLSVELPPGRPLDDDFLRACETADLTAQLIRRLLTGQPRQQRDRFPPSVTSSRMQADRAADAWTEAVNRVLDVGLRLTSFRSAALLVLDRDIGRLRLRAQRNVDDQTVMMFGRPLDSAPFDLEALRHDATVVCRRQNQFSEWLPDGMSLGVCQGIRTSEGLEGTLWVFDRRDRRLTVREQAILDSIAARLAELVEQAQQIEESALQRRLKAELRIAAESQPRRLTGWQSPAGWCHVAGRTESAREVGGDLCELIPLGDDRLLLAIGDAAGQSIPAAMVMSAVRGALRVFVDPANPSQNAPDRIMSRLNNVLHGIVESHQFMSLTCAVIDRESATLTLSNAGHPPALLIRGGTAKSIEVPGLLLGVVEDTVYPPRTIALQCGDLIVFSSDGVTEARSRDRAQFRSAGISDVIFPIADSSPEFIVEQVWQQLAAHTTGTEADDRTLVVTRYRGTDSTTTSGPSQTPHAFANPARRTSTPARPA